MNSLTILSLFLFYISGVFTGLYGSVKLRGDDHWPDH